MYLRSRAGFRPSTGRRSGTWSDVWSCCCTSLGASGALCYRCTSRWCTSWCWCCLGSRVPDLVPVCSGPLPRRESSHDKLEIISRKKKDIVYFIIQYKLFKFKTKFTIQGKETSIKTLKTWWPWCHTIVKKQWWIKWFVDLNVIGAVQCCTAPIKFRSTSYIVVHPSTNSFKDFEEKKIHEIRDRL